MQSPIQILWESYQHHLDDYSAYVLMRHDIQCETKAEAISVLENYSPDGDWENTCWEAWHLAGISESKHAIDRWTSTLIAQLRKISDGIECDNFTRENIASLISSLQKR